MDAEELVDRIVDIADSKKADNIVTVSMTRKSSIADYFVICEGGSDRQVSAIAQEIEDRLQESDIRPLHRDGRGTDGWMVLDYNQVIVHIFRPAERQLFRLEELWGRKRTASEGMENTADRAPLPARSNRRH